MRRDHPLVLPMGTALLAALAYLLSAQWIAGSPAFPLDDAWIHQTYARSVATSGRWAYAGGEASSGSTSPLWTLLLVPGHLLGLSPLLWATTLGMAAWGGTIAGGYHLARLLLADRRVAAAAALAIGAEWHLAWAALSGMEILLYAALALLLMIVVLGERGPPLGWGLLGALLTLTRPEGILLLGLLALYRLWSRRANPRAALREIVWLAAGWILLVTPALLFNWRVSGLLLPNTFYAKQQEYAILLHDVPTWRQLLRLAWQPWIGGQTLLLLALPWLPRRHWPTVAWVPGLWAAGIILLYALRLPVTYQHGRYLMPVIPVLLIYGVAALTALLDRSPPLLRRPLMAAVGTGFLLFLLLGATAYGRDVAVIECEMAASATWIATNSPPETLIAAHDIGRLGYLTERPILDLAGLISPEVIPIIRDEAALLALARRRGARYLVTFEDWYPTLVRDPALTPVHTTDCAGTRAAGQAPMTIYQIAP